MSVANRSKIFARYNEFFLDLPYKDIAKVGSLLKAFSQYCQKQYQTKTPDVIIQNFLKTNKINQEKKQIKLLLRFLQFIERQIALYDAVEDAQLTMNNDSLAELKKANLHLVLTAHPTQFYPPQVLSLITDIRRAIMLNDSELVFQHLVQLSMTSFRNTEKPTPLNEAQVLYHYLNNSLYKVIRTIVTENPKHQVSIGFWPGGDRDGNPFVSADDTKQVAADLKAMIIRLYLVEIDGLQKRITFSGMWQKISVIKNKLLQDEYVSCDSLITDLSQIATMIKKEFKGLNVQLIEALIKVIQCFGFYFASIDIRQTAEVHGEILELLLPEYSSSTEKVDLLKTSLLKKAKKIAQKTLQKHAQGVDVIESLQAMQSIQKQNGVAGCHRYIISNTDSAQHVLEVMLLAYWAGTDMNIDFVPLFESISDLQNACDIMQTLYKTSVYRKHLEKRKVQIIMLGFSDGTKDGGYFTANWEIYQAKSRLMKQAKKAKINLIFFDGRGGPPARGGGNTHLFYRSQQAELNLATIQLTVQGQTISSKYGSEKLAQHNIKQLLLALKKTKASDKPSKNDTELMQQISTLSFNKYAALKDHPLFTRYLTEVTPMKYYGELNIASRPSSRKSTKQFSFSDLRAIPFVGAWTQMKQNIPGFYGLGSALQQLLNNKQLKSLQKLYKTNLFFNTVIKNAMQSLSKTNFALTAYLKDDPTYAEFWLLLKQEAVLTEQMILKVTGQRRLLQHDSQLASSIAEREKLVLPLTVIQQYLLKSYREDQKNLNSSQKQTIKKLIMKSMAAVINASRNAV